MLAVLGKPKNVWASEDIASLRGMASQLRDGQATAEQLFPAPARPQEVPSPAPAPSAAPKSKKARSPRPPEATLGAPAPMQRPLGNGAPGPGSSGPSSLLPPPAAPEDLEAIRQTCLEKQIELELILEKWQVSHLEVLDEARAQEVQEYLKGQ